MRRRTLAGLAAGVLVVTATASATVGLVLLVTTHAMPAEPGATLVPVRFGLFGRAAPDDAAEGGVALAAMARSACRLRLVAES